MAQTVPSPERDHARRRAAEASDAELLKGWALRALLGCAIFGGATVLGRGEPLTLRNVVGYGLLFGVLVATLHFLVALYQRRRARGSRGDG
jgi:hypothetical protein